MSCISTKDLVEWCRVPASELENHPDKKIPIRLCKNSLEMGQIMARELIDVIRARNAIGEPTRAIVPCGPLVWYPFFTDWVNRESLCLEHLVVFHMDECLDWQAKPLPRNHPFNFRTYMEENFYNPVRPELRVPDDNRFWLDASNVEQIQKKIEQTPIDITLGGWGQDGHLAFNQARRHPYNSLTVDELRNSTARIQENNYDTVLALAQRTLGSAYQLIPPMSVTLGMREVLKASQVRVFSDTGAWKQTALRVALFGPLTPEYPITLLQEHPDAMLTATLETANHPISLHPEWDLGVS